ncbi:P27 family phage terminase small subunit [Bradyrhizobium liaoningense]|uniref:P27 family phage terminase small subunit n=1 Tax=Bradyrhizobium liaoningense TaxID=43992 RepID=UPI001BA765C1|nr:P27 family phage terminase small subunit [Bradyrhizobium liaoningense]MBR0945953.1 P27 family phage terminase small subunit [Bradyrhizobium liaoningense]
MTVLKLVKKAPAREPAAPKNLGKAAKAEWLRLAGLLRAKGTLSPENEPLLTTYVSAMELIESCDKELGRGKLVIKGPGGTMRPHPLIGPRNKAAQNALQLAKRLGIIGTGAATAPEGEGDAWSGMDL